MPQRWQRLADCGPIPDEARRRAEQLYPDSAKHLTRKRDAGRADAILIATADYGCLPPPRGVPMELTRDRMPPSNSYIGAAPRDPATAVTAGSGLQGDRRIPLPSRRRGQRGGLSIRLTVTKQPDRDQQAALAEAAAARQAFIAETREAPPITPAETRAFLMKVPPPDVIEAWPRTPKSGELSTEGRNSGGMSTSRRSAPC